MMATSHGFCGPPGFHDFHGLQLFQQPLTPSADLLVQFGHAT